IADLKGKEYEKSLVWQTEEGFNVQPFYNSADIAKIEEDLAHTHNSLLNTENPDFGYRYWANLQKIEVNDLEIANKQALKALQTGADGIVFYINSIISSDNLGVLLKNIELSYCVVSFRLKGLPGNFLQNLSVHVKKVNIAREKINGELICDFAEAGETELFSIFDQLAQLPNYKLQISLGSTQLMYTTETADLLAEAVKLTSTLVERGKEAKEIIPQISFGLHLRNNYFFEIARIRALRFLFTEIADSYGINFNPADLVISAFTTVRIDETTKEDPYLNMLSNTSQAMSGIIGGCNMLTVFPHNENLEETDEFSMHIARNVSNILKDEAYFDKVADPAAGSYYLEKLTEQIAAKSWEAFQEQV
ncbi:MAG: methylmalonyl-CoA mutase family protein, partial [Bacteroidota bacterium]